MVVSEEDSKEFGKVWLVLLIGLIAGGILEFSGIARGPVNCFVVQSAVIELFLFNRFFRLPRHVDAENLRYMQVVYGILIVLNALATIPFLFDS